MNRPLSRLLAGRKRPYVVLVVLWILLRVTILITGLLLQAVFDVIHGGSMTRVWVLLALLVANESVRLTMWYAVVLARLEIGYTFSVRLGLQDRVLRSTLARPGALALGRPAGDVVSRLGGDTDEIGVFAVWSAGAISRLTIAVAAIIIMLTINVWATIALAIPVVAVTCFGRVLNKPVSRYRVAAREAAGEVSTIVGETVGGLLAIKAACAEKRMIDRLRRASAVRGSAEVRDETLISLQQSIFRSTAALGICLVLLVVAQQMRNGRFSVGDLVLYVFYIQFITQAVDALGQFMGRATRATLSLKRIAELTGGMAEAVRCEPVYFDGVVPAVARPQETEPTRLVGANALTYRYDGQGGVAGVDLELAPGSVTVIAGPVGSGKTTLVRTLLGLLPAQSGEIRWNGEPVAAPDDFFVPPRAAYVPQVPHLFSGTIRENILVGGDYDDQALARAVRLAALEPDLATMTDGLDTLIGPKGMRLSGGQAQRVAIARMIVRDPELMVLDDASNALDVETERELWGNLLGTGRMLLVVTNRPELIARADTVVRLDAGRPQHDPDPDEDAATQPLVEALAEQLRPSGSGGGAAV